MTLPRRLWKRHEEKQPQCTRKPWHTAALRAGAGRAAGLGVCTPAGAGRSGTSGAGPLRSRYRRRCPHPPAGPLQRFGPAGGTPVRMDLREGDAVQAGDVLARITPALPALLDARSLREQQARWKPRRRGCSGPTCARHAAVRRWSKPSDARRTEQLAQQGFVAPRGAMPSAWRLHWPARMSRSRSRTSARACRPGAGPRCAGGGAAPGSAPGAREFEVRAPVSGRVLRVAQASEAMVALGTVLVELGDTTQLEVVAPLLSTDALQVRAGSPCASSAGAGPVCCRGACAAWNRRRSPRCRPWGRGAARERAH